MEPEFTLVMQTCLRALIALLLMACWESPLHADTFQTFNFNYSGAAFGNSAIATGQVNLDETLLPNPGSSFDNSGFVQYFILTISGAASGNGTFTKNDFGTFYWDTGGATLDLTHNLIGQPTSGSTWGSRDGGGGDFNVFASASGAPYGSYYFTLATDSGAGDPLQLTSFVITPEPGTSALLLFAGSGLLGLGAWRRAANS